MKNYLIEVIVNYKKAARVLKRVTLYLSLHSHGANFGFFYLKLNERDV